ncbi:uncharacterized protein Triagg1_2353 [Trichoderma aggressivum f. europaeum]|uniref:Uncharacterized protein n=1 Tax=Trichoderma aggressivum f. europaeum TaxID=173218 RepID=A0AAE1JET6_9HYPO|nr:hypothetical protein Triagg1_2353 [Trichoderma aggressivum f. europaeum]
MAPLCWSWQSQEQRVYDSGIAFPHNGAVHRFIGPPKSVAAQRGREPAFFVAGVGVNAAHVDDYLAGFQQCIECQETSVVTSTRGSIGGQRWWEMACPNLGG